jgi:mono/diheme cytochrome c family protein
MPFVTRTSLLWLGVLAAAGAATATGFLWSGIYNIAADDPHTRPVYAALDTLREHSIERRARGIVAPDLGDPALVRQGAGNYAAMCAGCHRVPGGGETELSRGLYPAPPALAEGTPDDPAHQFWVIKHGIKASGMPAWGRSMEDEYIWGMVALLQQLPKMSPQQYHALVESSGGHAHGGGEDHHEHGAEGEAHGHGAEGEAHGHAPAGSADAHEHEHEHATAGPVAAHEPAAAAAPTTYTHRHADGTVETHTAPAEDEAHHDHDHQH